ncbi:DUF6089 family protein [Parafilimonas sp.]|uniref:DUF6089 family protein n=1 Tax=Parafilimonas sp. TaxID=1969739 RepID=UPI0039E6C6A7
MKRAVFSIAVIVTALNAAAQTAWYITGGLGPMNYFGDLQDKQVTFNQVKRGGFAGLSCKITPHIATGIAFSYGALKANDAENGRKWVKRNLSFQSSILEVAATAQYDLFNIEQPDEGNIAEANPRKFTPYIFAGIGMVHFNPWTYDQSGQKVYLQPLGTEGQASPYPLWAVSFPMGIGVKYALTHTIMVSCAFNLRKTLTDYIDDVSIHQYPDTVQLLSTHGQQAASLSYRADEIPNNDYKFYGYRGNPDKKDGFYTFVLTISFQLYRAPKFYYGY